MDLMIDLETLGVAPGCPILSIGARGFHLNGDASDGPKFYQVLDWQQQVDMGARVEDSTVEWWKSQKPEAWAAATTNPIFVDKVIHDLRIFVAEVKPRAIWCQGQDFDFPILNTMLRGFRLKPLWKFTDQRDTRTIYDLANRLTGLNVYDLPREGTHHNALDDCDHQIVCLCTAFRDIVDGGAAPNDRTRPGFQRPEGV